MAPIFTGRSFGFGRIAQAILLPTYTVTPTASSVNEGSSISFNVLTTNVSNGTTLYWTLNTVSGTINSSDFSGGAVSGSFTITNGIGSVTLTIATDLTTEGTESFQLQVRTDSTSGTVVVTSSTVTINDTSTTPINASGGTVSTPGDGFRYHAFTSVGPSSFVVNSAPSGSSITVLIVGGGGSGGGGWGGSGGGAGGVMYASAYPVPTGPTTYPLSIGGGSSNGSQNVPGSPGTGSVFNGVPAGGGGGGTGGSPGNNTGGAQGTCSPNGAFTAYGPYPGGSPPVSPGGGGGGAGGSGNPSGQGGIGARFPAFTNYGTPGPAGSGGYFAGGGGTNPVNPGSAGGGSNSPTPAVANTGGGGGSNSDGYPNTSAAGIILIRYPY